ncbi:unnamed protein product [Cuscuta campestris]|uniref:Uncharacterized protein n=1 Tax=Cuscuta campestris TaxID=132261 RepID=A0A484LAF9_9ASTE|nr:unnamed protein product [Cuscuta campestris]
MEEPNPGTLSTYWRKNTSTNQRFDSTSRPSDFIHSNLLEYRTNSQQTANLQASLTLGHDTFTLFHSFYNQTYCVSVEGKRNCIIWLDSDLLSWLVECLLKISFEPCWVFSRITEKRTLKVGRESDFISISESRMEGTRSISLPRGMNNLLLRKFISNLQSFCSSSSAKQNISTKPSKDLPTGNEENNRSPLHPRQNISTTDKQKSSVTPRTFQFADQQNTYGNLSIAESRDYATSRGEWLPSVHKPYNLDISLTTSLLCWESETPNLPTPCDGEFPGLCSYDRMIFDQDTCSKSLLAMDIGPLSHAEFYNANTNTPFSARERSLSGKALTQIAPGFPASRVRGTQSEPPRPLSPTAPPFIPSSYNSFRILETCQDSEEPPVEQSLNGDRDKIDLLNCFSTSRLLKLYALEDVAPYSGEPALYTHSEGESIALNDSKLEPCRFSIPSSSTVSMSFPKLIKGKTTSSPSHMVTMSRARQLAEGRRKAPIRGVDTSDDDEESLFDGIHSAFKRSCPTIQTKKTCAPAPVPQSPQPKLTKNQKKKAKTKIKKARAAEAHIALKAKISELYEHFEEDYDCVDFL